VTSPARESAAEKGGRTEVAQRVVAPPDRQPVQAKLRVGEVDDPYEREADRVAAEVVRRLSTSASWPSSGTVQREYVDDHYSSPQLPDHEQPDDDHYSRPGLPKYVDEHDADEPHEAKYVDEDDPDALHEAKYVDEDDDDSLYPAAYVDPPEVEPVVMKNEHDMDGLAKQIEQEAKQPEAPRYSRIRKLDPHYSTESLDGSPDLPFIIEMGYKLVKSGKVKSIHEFMISQFGWAHEDVEKYIIKGEKSKVEYIKTEEQRQDYELNLGGTITQGKSVEPFDTSEMFSKHSGKGFGIYVMSPSGTFYVDQHKVSLFHHSSFLAGGDVAGGGEIMIHNGTLKVVTNKTGHYGAKPQEFGFVEPLKGAPPDPAQTAKNAEAVHQSEVVNNEVLWQVLDGFKSGGVSLSGVEIRNDFRVKTAWPGGDAQAFWEQYKPS
jgi:hypothetical protein